MRLVVFLLATVVVYLMACGPRDTSTQLGPDCDRAYPGVCIPSPPPDLNCGDIEHRGFVVLPPDPHGFDGDRDGVGCEGR